jgi:hypothetical protein
MTDLSPNDLSHLSDEEFNALAPQGYHATGPAEALLPAENCITFTAPATEEVLRIDKEGFHYRGQFIADAGEAHRLMLEFLKQNTRAPLAQPKPQGPTVMEIVALAGEIEEEGLGQVDLVRRALARWGRPAAELEQSL